MTALARLRPSVRPSLVSDALFARQRTLATYGLALLALCAVLVAIEPFDARMIDDVSVWSKPAKFAFSIAVFTLTTAWFFGCVRPERRQARTMRALVAILIVSSGFELAYIIWQGAHDLPSHFNRSSPFYEVMYGLMGVGALLLTATSPMLAWEIARRPAAGLSRTYLVAVVTGLVLCFVLGAGVGMYMAQGTSHSVGQSGGHLAVFGWNRRGGDLRIAHFLGIHAQQAIPLIGAFLTRAPVKRQVGTLTLGTSLYVAVTLAVLAQAIAGNPLLPGLA